jgi:hypothetical protein
MFFSRLRTLGCVFLLAGVIGKAKEVTAGSEYRVKGEFLLKLAKFIEWPGTPLPKSESPFVIAVMDRGEATPLLTPYLAGREIEGRRVAVRFVSTGTPPKDAQILFVTRAAGVAPEEVRDALGSAATLLVGETEQFAERGGALAFVDEGRTVRLTLCREHAVENGLKVSASLAKVARVVRSARKS